MMKVKIIEKYYLEDYLKIDSFRKLKQSFKRYWQGIIKGWVLSVFGRNDIAAALLRCVLIQLA